MTEIAPPSSLLASRAARVTMVMSALFAMTGVAMVFLPRWLETERGLTGAEIGAVLSLSQFARIVTGPAIAHWADSARDRSMPIKMIFLASLAAFAVFLWVARGFWPLLAAGFLALTLVQMLTPLIEAAALRATAQGKMNYGVSRGIGSVAFIVANVAGGAVVARFGAGAMAVWVMCALVLGNCASWFGLQRDPPAARTRETAAGAIGALLRNRRFLILIAASGLIQASHGFYYGFSTLAWRGQGVSASMVGLLWGFGVGVEVAFLWSLGAIERRVSPRAMILAGAGAGVIRWTALGFAPLGFVLWPLQALHALSFAATHVGVMRLIFREAGEGQATMAQTLYAALSAGVLMGATTLLSGRLYDLWDARGYWAMAVAAAAGGALALWLRPDPERAPGATLR